jgi:hypothetical protein
MRLDKKRKINKIKTKHYNRYSAHQETCQHTYQNVFSPEAKCLLTDPENKSAGF